jgi:aldehyde:ferredoxin oxidoreductase
MMHGWTGKLLIIDVSAQSVDVQSPDPSIYHRFIGGRGLAGFYLRQFAARRWDGPEMPFMVFTGPLVGTLAPTSGRAAVMSCSPLTGTIGDASVGGRFGTELKNAGWDGIIVFGRAAALTGIEIDNQQVVFTDAGHLRNMEIPVIGKKLKEKGAYGVTGPAAENAVRFANIMFDGHFAAGRNGLGLSLASKNVKYITVKGNGKVRVFDPEGLKNAREDILRLTAASPVLMGELGITHYGTAALYDLTSSRKMMPTDNFRKTFFTSARTTNAHAYKIRYAPRKAGCRGCHVLCKKIGRSGEVLPEFETMNHFSALLNNDDISVVVSANTLCNAMGMDTISAGATLACFAEINNCRLSGEKILALLKDIALGRGIGKDLAQGSYAYAAAQGRPEASMTVKKQEIPAYDPRGAYGMALGYAVSTRGGCHLRSYAIGAEVLRKPAPIDRFTFSGKARIIKIAEDLNAVVDSLTACKFIFFGATMEEYARAFASVTGIPSSGQELMKTGERICYNERIMNHQRGFTIEDDELPERFFKEPGFRDDVVAVPPIPRQDFLKARENYYRIRGLDEIGRPLEQKAAELGLEWNG